MIKSDIAGKKITAREQIGRIVAYIVFIVWTLITVIPLIWLLAASFKTNDEIVLYPFSIPNDLFDNAEDEYVVIRPALNLVYDYDRDADKRERLIIESTAIAPTRRLMVHFLLKEELPPEIANLPIGSKITVSQLPSHMQMGIHWRTIWFNFYSSFVRGRLDVKFINSVIYSGVGTFFVILLSLMVGFALSKLPFKRLSLVIGGLIGLGYLISVNAVIIPLFLMMSSIRLTNTHFGIILVYIAFGLPMSVMLSTTFLHGIPDSLIESAYMDGASTFRMFFSIIVPMSVPVAITIGIINALGIWNEFLLVLVLASSEGTKSLPVAIFGFTTLSSMQMGWQMAAMVIALLPVVVIYFIFNKRLARGVVAGAIK